jgi:hypothetical protein
MAEEADKEPAWRKIASGVTIAVTAAFLTWLASYGWARWTAEPQVLEFTSTVSGNLASIPDGLPGELEITYAISPNQREKVRGLFRFTVTVINRAVVAAENIPVSIVWSEAVEFLPTPDITTTPRDLRRAIRIDQQSNMQERSSQFQASVLRPNDAITFSFVGYLREPPQNVVKPLTVYIQKSGWIAKAGSESGWYDVATYNPGSTYYSGYPVGLPELSFSALVVLVTLPLFMSLIGMLLFWMYLRHVPRLAERAASQLVSRYRRPAK